VQETTVATLAVTECPFGSVNISIYSSVACPSDFSGSDDLSVLYTCSHGILTLHNAFLKATGAVYTGSYIITGYSFRSATVTNGSASFYFQSLTCLPDICNQNTPFVSGCTTTNSSSSSDDASIFVFSSTGEQTVDFCFGGGSNCCSDVVDSKCANATQSAPVGELILNPGFETGDFSDWVLSGNVDGNTTVWNTNAHSGIYVARVGAEFAPVFICQNFSVSLNTTYSLSFYARFASVDPSCSFFQARINNDTVFDQVNLVSPALMTWHKYNETYFSGSNSYADLCFVIRNDEGYDRLDDVYFG